MTEQSTVNASSFGAIGFGLAIVLLALYFAQIMDSNGLGVVLSTAFFAGGFFPFIAGLWSLKTGDSFTAVAFLLGSMFWFSYTFFYFLPALGVTSPIVEPALGMWVQVPFFFLWGIIAFWLFLGSLKTNRVLQLFFFMLALFFWLVAFGHWYAWDTWHNTTIMNNTLNILAGYEGIICGFTGIYYGLARMFNDAFSRELMPLGRIPSKP
ncbi:MAG: acetate uptake transporter [Candidatus Hodarchaeota archaeon]